MNISCHHAGPGGMRGVAQRRWSGGGNIKAESRLNCSRGLLSPERVRVCAGVRVDAAVRRVADERGIRIGAMCQRVVADARGVGLERCLETTLDEFCRTEHY